VCQGYILEYKPPTRGAFTHFNLLCLKYRNFNHAAPSGAAFFIAVKVFMKITGASIKQNKQRGEWAELRFMARASEHGLSISKPWGDSCRYDFIVEHAGKFLRVQVQKRKSWAYHVNMAGLTPVSKLTSSPSTSSPKTPGTFFP
jgi:hypothetical protein